MDATAALKAEIKAWEREFRAQNGRAATVEDIKTLPHVAEKYKLYKKLTKEAEARSVRERQPLEPPKTPPPSRARPKQNNAVPPGAIIPKSRPVTSATDTSTKNPFSPVKRKMGNATASSSHVNPFLTPVKTNRPLSRTPSPPSLVPSLPSVPAPAPLISKARKRLRGEPVSPSPKPREKRRRLEAANLSRGDEHVSRSRSSSPAAEGDSYVDDSPVKAPASGKAFKPLFEERVVMPSSQHGVSRPEAGNRSKVFARAKTMPGGLFGSVGAGKDARASFGSDVIEGEGDAAREPHGTMTKGKQKGKEKEQFADAAQNHRKKRILPGPKGLIPGKDDLFEIIPPAAESSSSARSHKASTSRKRSLSEATKDDKDLQTMSNTWNLLPPSPPPADESRWQKSNGKGKAKWKDTSKGKKKTKISPDGSAEEDMEQHSSDDAEVEIVSWRGRPPSPHPTDDDNPALELDPELRVHLRGRQTQTSSLLTSPELEKFEVDLPEDMRRVLALSPSDRKREREEEELVKGLVKGVRKGGGEVWGPGEMDGEGGESDEEPILDDWEGEGMPWAVAEL